MLTYFLAVLAACANATSSVLQRKANREVPKNENMSPRLIWSLAHKPAWFGGVVAVTAGFLLQAAALGNGQLSVVEPMLVLELPATLILASWVFHASLGRREWASVVLMAATLASLLFGLSPSAGQSSNVRWYAWAIALGVNLGVAGTLVAFGRRGPAGRGGDGGRGDGGRGDGGRGGDGGDGGDGGRKEKTGSARQAALFGVAAGSTFGLTAALMKAMTGTFANGFASLFTHWQLYGMVATGVLGMFLLQSAMNAGRLIAAQPGLTLSDPIVSILWGVLVYGEQVRTGWFVALDVVSALLLATGVVILIRSPLLSDESGAPEEGESSGRRTAVRNAED